MRTFYALFALAIGLVIPLQAAVNNQLKITLGSSTLMAALVSFACGTLTLVIAALLMQERWGSLAQIAQAPWWQLTGGTMGALLTVAGVVLVNFGDRVEGLMGRS